MGPYPIDQLAAVQNGQPKEVDMDEPEDDGHERTPERGNWTGRFDFLVSMIAYAVGLGNVWRFPYLCFKNGGGAFLVAYACFWTIAAVPIFLLEVTVGQYLQRGGIAVWNVCPIFKGVGLANVTITCMCVGYYCIICCWAIYYLIASFSSIFPWELCGQSWNTDSCLSLSSPTSNSSTIVNRTNMQTSVEQYWERRVLQQSSGIGDFGSFQIELVGTVLIAWAAIYLCLCKGITKARLLVYICAFTPYFILAILLVCSATLEGAGTGIYYYLWPQLDKLQEPTLWKDAGTQVFYSYGIGYGALTALGSYNKYHHNCYRDVLVLCVINGCTSLLAGTVVFSILGHMATVAGVPVGEVVKSGVGLAFLSYPEAVAQLPMKQLWAVLLFLILAILGMDTQICLVEGLSTALSDVMPKRLRKHKWALVGVICILAFISGLPMLTHAGVYWLTLDCPLVDAYGASGICLCFIVFFEVVGLSYGFGASRLFDGLSHMIGFRPCFLWKFFWMVTAPLSCFGLMIFLMYRYEPLLYADNTPYPDWALNLGHMLSAMSMLCIPCYALYFMMFEARGTFRERLRQGFTPVQFLTEVPLSQ